jgi:hypothetical protein
MELIREFRLKEGYYTDDYKKVQIVDADTDEVIADKVKVEYAKAIIEAVNNYKKDG